MRTCDEIRPRLSAYVDNELSELEREGVHRHVAVCRSCTEELREIEEAAALIGQLERVDPPATLEPGLRRRIRRRAAAYFAIGILLLLAVIPALTMVPVVLQPDLPLWARLGFVTSAICLTVALALLIYYLLRHVRNLVIYGYLSGGER